MSRVSFKNISKIFDDGTNAVSDFNLDIDDGELVVLVGPSGCGKSTLLRMLAGLETVSSGELLIDDEVVNALSPQQRNIAMVFQNYALYPHMSVQRNLAFPLKMMGLSKNDIATKVAEVAELLGLTALLERKPKQLSGGQRQRVAMGRAIVRDPKVFLMDEPLSNLDAKLRLQIRSEIAALQRRMATTTLYVTHDQIEAMTLGDRVAVIERGELQQVAPPQQLYERPANIFVAGFIGNPGMNVFETRLLVQDHGLAIEWGDQQLALPLNQERLALLRHHIGQPLLAGLRPEAFRASGLGCEIMVELESVEALGHEFLLYFHSAVTALTSDKTMPEEAAKSPPMVARVAQRPTAKRGEPMRLAVALAELYFFDLDGQALIKSCP